ncbi:MAG TPA: DUF1292 domain-containing protein [Clostridiales bacterium]|nr:DUF1292 domain-containing protein [Clostridiales bacterium]
MDNEKNIVLFTDEDGSEYPMEIIDLFEYDGEEFAMLMEADYECNDECPECNEDERDIYIMQVSSDEEGEVFLPIDDDKLDEIVDALEQFFNEHNGIEEE